VVEAWAFDEHRLGLKPIIRRIWAPKGQRPKARARPRYQWLYLYAYVQPQTGEVEWLLADTVNTEMMNESLRLFAKSVGAGKDRIIVLAIDNAGWHRAKKLKVPGGIHIEYLPPYTPELQPAERLWPLANEGVANRSFQSLEDLNHAVEKRCLQLSGQTHTIRDYTKFHWWPHSQL
jgi:transposase